MELRIGKLNTEYLVYTWYRYNYKCIIQSFHCYGLSPSFYDFWLRDSCSATDLSDWAGPFSASTSCGIAVAPYLEDFENGFNGGIDNGQGHNIGATISPCWTRTDTDTNYRWGGRTGGTATGPTGPSGDHTTGFGSYVYTEASFSNGTPTATLTSPSIDLSALTTPELTFWYHMWAQGGGTQGTLSLGCTKMLLLVLGLI